MTKWQEDYMAHLATLSLEDLVNEVFEVRPSNFPEDQWKAAAVNEYIIDNLDRLADEHTRRPHASQTHL